MSFTPQQRLNLLLVAVACIFVTWLISSTLAPPVDPGWSCGGYRLLRTPHGYRK
jgi:hypothetical protein